MHKTMRPHNKDGSLERQKECGSLTTLLNSFSNPELPTPRTFNIQDNWMSLVLKSLLVELIWIELRTFLTVWCSSFPLSFLSQWKESCLLQMPPTSVRRTSPSYILSTFSMNCQLSLHWILLFTWVWSETISFWSSILTCHLLPSHQFVFSSISMSIPSFLCLTLS